MANNQTLYLSTKKVFRSLFDEHRIIWDMLRSHSYFVAKQTVKQFIPPESFVARNYISTDDTCKIRMSRLQILPWLSFFVTPDNAILYSEGDPIVPTEKSKWTVANYDNCKLGLVDSYDPSQQGFHVDEIPMTTNMDTSIQFIPSRNIAIPQEHRALNFNPNAPSDIRTEATTFISSNSICNPQFDLEIGLSTREDFRQGNTDSDINRFERLDYNKLGENRMKNALLRTSLPATDATTYNPNYAKLDDSWNKYLALIDGERSETPSPTKRRRDNAPLSDTLSSAYPEQEVAEPMPSTTHQADFFT